MHLNIQKQPYAFMLLLLVKLSLKKKKKKKIILMGDFNVNLLCSDLYKETSNFIWIKFTQTIFFQQSTYQPAKQLHLKL